MSSATQKNDCPVAAGRVVQKAPIPENQSAVEHINFTPRDLRLIRAIWSGWVKREMVDHLVGCSNAPDQVMRLRRKIGEDAIETRELRGLDRDGRATKYGEYRMTQAGQERLAMMGLGGGC